MDDLNLKDVPFAEWLEKVLPQLCRQDAKAIAILCVKTDSDCIRRRDVLDLFVQWEDDLTRQIEESIEFPHTRHDLKVCRTQLEDCIRAIREFPAADGVGERLEKLEQLEKLLPVRPGGVVYETDGVRVYQRTVRRIVFDCGTFAFDEDALANGNVFLTEREAEMAAGLFRKPEAGTGEKEGGS